MKVIRILSDRHGWYEDGRGGVDVEDSPDSGGEVGPVRGEERGHSGEDSQGVQLQVHSWWLELE